MANNNYGEFTGLNQDGLLFLFQLLMSLRRYMIM